MTEGPTARLRAIQIEEKFVGHYVTAIETRSKRLHIDYHEIVGKKLEKTTSYGKNILLYFNGYIIRIHLMMYGSIRYERSKPDRYLRLFISFDNGNLFVYNAPIIEIGNKEIEENLTKEYGVDPLFNWDEKRLFNLILKNRDRKIGDVLLDQHVFAGVGNILRNEILFRAGISPERMIGDMSEEEIERIILYVKKLSNDFLKNKLKQNSIKNLLLVYNKKLCPICGKPLIFYRISKMLLHIISKFAFLPKEVFTFILSVIHQGINYSHHLFSDHI